MQRPPPPLPKRKRAPANGSEAAAAGGGGGEGEGALEDAAAAGVALAEEEEEEEEPEKEYMVFLLSKPGDYWSREFDALVAGVAPCFPSVLFLRGRSTEHHGLVGQMALRSLPKLFLFEDSLLKARACVRVYFVLWWARCSRPRI